MSNKQSSKKDDTKINFRISKELKAKLEEKAREKNITTSAYVRDLLESIQNGKYCQKEEYQSKIKSFLFSKEFLQLMIWINLKRLNEKKTEENYELDGYIKTLKQIEGHLPDNLVKEFDKVLNDVLYVRSETGYDGNKFNFTDSLYEAKRFNMKLVGEFFLNKKLLEKFIGGYSEYEIGVEYRNDIEM